MGRIRVLVVMVVLCLTAGVMSSPSTAKSAGPKSPGPMGAGGTAEVPYFTSVCAGPRSSETFVVDGATVPADLACDEEHGVTAIDGLTSPRVFSDCAGQGSWRPGNNHPCPYGSVGLLGVDGDYTTTFGWDESTAAGTVFAYEQTVIRFRTAAGGVVVASQDSELVATHLRLYLHAFPDGAKYTTNPDEAALQLGCALPEGVSVTVRIRADGIPIYPGKGDRADTRTGPVAHVSVGDVVLIPADGQVSGHVNIDVDTCAPGQ